MNYIIISLIIFVGGFFISRIKKDANASELSEYRSIDVAEAKKIMRAQAPVFLDVRTTAEVSGGRIKNAIHVDVTSPSFKSGIRDLDKDKTYVVYCRSGRRSVTACKLMAQAGFTDLYNLKGGYNDWK